MRLKDKRAIVTAAASGMGRAGCEAFARHGASVVAIDIDGDRLHAVVEGIKAAGGRAWGIRADLLKPQNCRQAVDEAAAILGGIDILWNHVGMPGMRDVETMDVTEYARVMDLNVLSGLAATGAAWPHLRKPGASIMFTASTAGLVGASVSPVYSAAKFAVVGVAKSLALRYAAEGVRVNAICPGPIDTPMFPQFFDPKASPEAAAKSQAAVLAAVPLGRLGRAEEVASAAVWLASDESSFVTGIALPVDGGYTAR